MKTTIVILALLMLCACSKKAEIGTVESGVYGLTADERNAAQVNAKQFYEKEWPTANGPVRGFFDSCRPTDSNANGLVSCFGKVPNDNGAGYKDVKRFCGYTPTIVGCSDEDTVAK